MWNLIEEIEYFDFYNVNLFRDYDGWFSLNKALKDDYMDRLVLCNRHHAYINMRYL